MRFDLDEEGPFPWSTPVYAEIDYKGIYAVKGDGVE